MSAQALDLSPDAPPSGAWGALLKGRLPDMQSPHLNRLIWALAIPSVIGLSANAGHQLVNAFFVGQLGTHALAAVALCFPLMVVFTAVGEGFGVGAASAIARYLGAEQAGRASGIASTMMVLVAALGVLLALLVVPWLAPLLQWMGAKPQDMDAALAYATVFVWTVPFMLLQMLCDFVAIAEGNARFSMWTLIGSFALNVILDPIFIFTLHGGVVGAAYATAVSCLAALAAYGVYFYRRWGRVRVAPSQLRWDPEALRSVASVGAGAAAATGLAALAYALVYRSASAFGETAVAAVAIALRLQAGGVLPLVGFCLGAQALLGFAWGAGQSQRYVQAVWRMLWIAGGFAVLYALGMIVLAPWVVVWFTEDPAVQAQAVVACRLVHACFATFGLYMVAVVSLQAAGRARQAAWLALAPQGYMLVPCLLVLPAVWGLAGVYASLGVAAVASAALAAVLLRTQLRGAVRQGERPPQ